MIKIRVLRELIRDGMAGIKSQFFSTRKDRWGYRGEHSLVVTPFHGIKENTYLYDHTYIGEGANLHNYDTKFIMKRNSSAAFGLVVTGGKHIYDEIDAIPEGEGWGHIESSRPTIVNEGVWLAGNVILGEGVEVGRGCVVGAGAVVRARKIPPYSILIGNPAKVVGFRFSPKEIIEYEKKYYSEEERLPLELLERNYEKFFLKRIKEIQEMNRL